MAGEPHVASFLKRARLVEKLRNREYRNSFVASRARRFLAHQIKSLRGKNSQAEFGKMLGKPQSVVSRLEDPNYGKWTFQTLLEMAAALDRAVLIQFVSWNTFLRITEDQTEQASAPTAFNSEELSQSASDELGSLPPSGWHMKLLNQLADITPFAGNQWDEILKSPEQIKQTSADSVAAYRQMTSQPPVLQ